MKRKLLLCVLVIVLCLSVFAACDQKIDHETLKEMKEFIYAANKDRAEITNADFELAAKAAYGDTICDVKWTSSVTEGVTISDPNEDGFVTVSVNWETQTDIPYTLTATLVNSKGVAYKDADGKDYAVSFNHKVPAFVVTDYAGFIANCKSEESPKPTINVKAYVLGAVSVTSSSKGSLYLQDAQGHGYYAYAPTLASSVTATNEALRKEFPIGTEVYVSGTGTVYSGQYEFNKGCAIRKTGRSVTAAELPYEDVTAKFAAATDNKDEALIPYQNKLVQIKNAEMVAVDGSYYYFKAGNVQYNLYKTDYFMEESELDTLVAKFAIGKKATIKGIVSVYSNVYQIYPLDVNAISDVVEVQRTDAEKAQIDAENIKTSAKQINKVDDKISLPTKGVAYDSTINWALKTGTTLGTIADGKYSVTALPDADTKVVLVATVKCGQATVEKEIEITVKEAQPANGVKLNGSNLGLEGKYADGTATVNKVAFEWKQLYFGKDGIQLRINKDTSVASSIWNTKAFDKKITSVKIVCTEGKVGYSNENFLKIEFANNAGFTDAETVMVSTVKGTLEYEVAVPEGDYTFIRITDNLSYTFYVQSLTILTAE